MINLTEQIQIPLEGNFTLKDIPFIGEMKFVPTIIEWKGTIRICAHTTPKQCNCDR